MGDQLGLIRVGKDNDDIIDLNPMPPEYRRLIHALVRRAGEPVSNDEFSLFFEDGEHTVEGFLLDVLADSTNVDGPLYPLVWRMRIDRAQQTCTFRAKDDG